MFLSCGSQRHRGKFSTLRNPGVKFPGVGGDGSETHKVSLESHTVIQERDGHSVDSLGYMIYNTVYQFCLNLHYG